MRAGQLALSPANYSTWTAGTPHHLGKTVEPVLLVCMQVSWPESLRAGELAQLFADYCIG